MLFLSIYSVFHFFASGCKCICYIIDHYPKQVSCGEGLSSLFLFTKALVVLFITFSILPFCEHPLLLRSCQHYWKDVCDGPKVGGAMYLDVRQEGVTVAQGTTPQLL